MLLSFPSNSAPKRRMRIASWDPFLIAAGESVPMELKRLHNEIFQWRQRGNILQHALWKQMLPICILSHVTHERDEQETSVEQKKSNLSSSETRYDASVAKVSARDQIDNSTSKYLLEAEWNRLQNERWVIARDFQLNNFIWRVPCDLITSLN